MGVEIILSEFPRKGLFAKKAASEDAAQLLFVNQFLQDCFFRTLPDVVHPANRPSIYNEDRTELTDAEYNFCAIQPFSQDDMKAFACDPTSR